MQFKGNVAVYEDLNLVTVIIKDISHVSTVKECNYRSVALALASIRSFAVGRAVLTYVYILVQRSSRFREYRPAREER